MIPVSAIAVILTTQLQCLQGSSLHLIPVNTYNTATVFTGIISPPHSSEYLQHSYSVLFFTTQILKCLIFAVRGSDILANQILKILVSFEAFLSNFML
jgi:hypothetical protein